MYKYSLLQTAKSKSFQTSCKLETDHLSRGRTLRGEDRPAGPGSEDVEYEYALVLAMAVPCTCRVRNIDPSVIGVTVQDVTS